MTCTKCTTQGTPSGVMPDGKFCSCPMANIARMSPIRMIDVNGKAEIDDAPANPE